MLDQFLEFSGAPPPNCIVHVGAHIGQELFEYQHYAPVDIYWIEADPEVYGKMLEYIRSSAISGVRQWMINALVSDSDGAEAAFRRAANHGQSSSMFAETELLRERWPDAVQTGEVLRLMTYRLETVLKSNGVAPEDAEYLVIDTQGAEMKCLRGAGAYLSQFSVVVAEASTDAFYQGGAQLDEIDDFLKTHGLVRVSPAPFAQHGDVIYIRDLNSAESDSETIPERDREMRQIFNEIVASIKAGELPDAESRIMEGAVPDNYLR